MKFGGQSFNRGNYPPVYEQAEKVFFFFFFFFFNPQINFSRRTHLDRSYIFCGFFRVSFGGFVNQLFNFSVIGFYRKFSFVFHDRLRV